MPEKSESIDNVLAELVLLGNVGINLFSTWLPFHADTSKICKG